MPCRTFFVRNRLKTNGRSFRPKVYFLALEFPERMPIKQEPIALHLPSTSQETVTIQLKVPYSEYKLYRKGSYQLCILPKRLTTQPKYQRATGEILLKAYLQLYLQGKVY